MGVPHASNWDFLYGWLAIEALNLDVKLFAKEVFFIWPINHICTFLGVLPVNRRKRSNVVDSVVEPLDKIDPLRFLITLQGTRSYQPSLKSGYYHVARKAIVIAGPNFAEKTFTIMLSRMPLAKFAKIK